jgi:hypothetical protein
VAVRRLSVLLFLLCAVPSSAAQYRTTNFFVNAPDPQIAKQMGDYAEHYRKEKAIMWLGQEMPTWPQPCPLYVTVNMEGPSGATSFQFGQGRVMSMKMEIQGPLERLLHSVLPHEITHTVFAHYFRQPVPRWADEGGSVLSEDDIERERHDRLTRQILNRGQQIPLRRLFGLKEYPREVMCLYAEGFSMSDYLVKRSDYKTFLHFVGHGMQYGWDSATQSFYGHKSVEELEEAWLKHLRDTKRSPSQPPAQVASANNTRPVGQPTSRPIVRLTAPPVQPLDPAPVYRGVSPTPEQMGQNFGPTPPTPSMNPYPQNQPPAAGWNPGRGQGAPAFLPVPVTLGPIANDAPANFVPPPPNYPVPPPPPNYGGAIGFPR